MTAGGPPWIPSLPYPAEISLPAATGQIQLGVATFPGPLTPPANGSWSQAAWCIDQSNATGAASDTNTGLDPAHPLLTAQEVVRRWGTTRPLLTLATTGPTCTIRYLSGTPTINDPGMFNPYCVGTKFVVTMQSAVPTGPVAIAGVVAKNPAGNQALNATIPAAAGVVVGSKIVNNSRGLSYARAFKNLGGTTWQLSQPVNPALGAGFHVVQNNAWANGDLVTVVPPATDAPGSTTVMNVDLAEMMPVVLDINGTFDNVPQLLNFNVSDLNPGTFGFAQLRLSGQVVCVDVSFAKHFWLSPEIGDVSFGAFLACDIENSGSGGYRFQATRFEAGQWTLNVGGVVDACSFDAGFMIKGHGGINDGVAAGVLGEVYVDGGLLTVTNAFGAGVLMQTTFNGGQPVIYGSGGLDNRGLLIYGGAAGQGVATFPCAGGLRIRNQATAYSFATGGGVVAVHQVALTPANLDAAAGAAGFGGYATWPGLGTFSNGTQT